MMAGGVFDRFPTMPTMILEAGVGWLPSMLERFEEHREAFGSLKAPEWKTPPMEIFERQMLVTVEACEATDLKIALEFLPADHVEDAGGRDPGAPGARRRPEAPPARAPPAAARRWPSPPGGTLGPSRPETRSRVGQGLGSAQPSMIMPPSTTST